MLEAGTTFDSERGARWTVSKRVYKDTEFIGDRASEHIKVDHRGGTTGGEGKGIAGDHRCCPVRHGIDWWLGEGRGWWPVVQFRGCSGWAWGVGRGACKGYPLPIRPIYTRDGLDPPLFRDSARRRRRRRQSPPQAGKYRGFCPPQAPPEARSAVAEFLMFLVLCFWTPLVKFYI